MNAINAVDCNQTVVSGENTNLDFVEQQCLVVMACGALVAVGCKAGVRYAGNAGNFPTADKPCDYW